MKHSRIDILVIGLALFSMFFGAGNIIFPPYLGMESGSQWLWGFVSYYVADIGLAVVSIFAVLKYRGNVDRLMGHIGDLPGRLMLSAIILCIGPLIAVPRTGATTYEMFVTPVFGEVGALIPNFLFFGIVLLLSIRESSVIDILGKFLTPALFIGLLILIAKGILTPVGTIAEFDQVSTAVVTGVSAGYQTMDVLAALAFGIIIVNTVAEKGYTGEKETYKVAASASIFAAVGLMIVYGGLTYLGATASAYRGGRVTRTELILYITEKLMGRYGVVLLGGVVMLACITTAVALISASSDYFSKLSRGRIRYEALTIILCIFSAVGSTIGTDQIVAIASPILSLLYPGMLTLVILSFFAGKTVNDYVIRGAVAGAIAASLLEILKGWGVPLDFVSHLPFASVGFGWIVPAVVTGVAVAVVRKLCLVSSVQD